MKGVLLLPAIREENLRATSLPSVLKPKPFGFLNITLEAASSNALSDATRFILML